MTSARSSAPLTRRRLLAGAAGAVALAGFARSLRVVAAQDQSITLGYQKAFSSLLVLNARGDVEAKLAPLGYTVSWAEFTSGPPLLEALNAGSIVFGATGAPPPIFAQAAGADLVYVFATASAPATEGIVVPPNSPILTVADLKGKKVAVTKGSSANATLVEAVRAGGLAWGEVEPVYLQPADAKAAYEGGSVDAWAIWDPFYAAVEVDSAARTLVTDGDVGLPNRSFYSASRQFATEQRDALAALVEILVETEAWAQANKTEVAKLSAAATGIPEATLQRAEERRTYGVFPITDEVITAQQALADTFFGLELIPEQLTITDAYLPDLADLIPATTASTN